VRRVDEVRGDPSQAPSAPAVSGGTSGGTLSCQRTMTSAWFESLTNAALNSPYRNWLSQTLRPRRINAGIVRADPRNSGREYGPGPVERLAGEVGEIAGVRFGAARSSQPARSRR